MGEDSEPTATGDLRTEALERIRKKDDFKVHALAYVLFNAVLVAVWIATGSGFFWPVVPMLGWGIGIVFHAWDVYHRPPTEERVRREMERLGGTA